MVAFPAQNMVYDARAHAQLNIRKIQMDRYYMNEYEYELGGIVLRSVGSAPLRCRWQGPRRNVIAMWAFTWIFVSHKQTENNVPFLISHIGKRATIYIS